jgi:short-subunit dehydrogenase
MASKQGKWALVTGGTSGIGYQLARLCAKDGYNLILVARDEGELRATEQKIKQEHHVEIMCISKDLFEVTASKEVYDIVSEKGYQVSLLINDAGQGEYGFFYETDIYRDLDIINLNVIAPVYLTKLFVNDMIARKEGKILFLASIVSKNPTPLLSVYSATKAFIYSFSVILRNELKDKGITVTALIPGSTDTNFFDKAGMLNTKEYNEYSLGDPQAVAKAGYEALMNNEEKVIAEGFKNKIMVDMSNVMPDSMIANNMRENHMQNVDGTQGKRGASESEGDYMRQAAKADRNNTNEGLRGNSGKNAPGNR